MSLNLLNNVFSMEASISTSHLLKLHIVSGVPPMTDVDFVVTDVMNLLSMTANLGRCRR